MKQSWNGRKYKHARANGTKFYDKIERKIYSVTDTLKREWRWPKGNRIRSTKYLKGVRRNFRRFKIFQMDNSLDIFFHQNMFAIDLKILVILKYRFIFKIDYLYI